MSRERTTRLFSTIQGTSPKQQQIQEQQQERLERKVGQLVVEVDWLKKKCKELGIDP
jgi:hypothetical protein